MAAGWVRPSWAAAARSARVSGATLVRALARLEARLQVALLQRSTRGVRFTEAGRAYLADCVRLLAAVDAAGHRVVPIPGPSSALAALAVAVLVFLQW